MGFWLYHEKREFDSEAKWLYRWSDRFLFIYFKIELHLLHIHWPKYTKNTPQTCRMNTKWHLIEIRRLAIWRLGFCQDSAEVTLTFLRMLTSWSKTFAWPWHQVIAKTRWCCGSFQFVLKINVPAVSNTFQRPVLSALYFAIRDLSSSSIEQTYKDTGIRKSLCFISVISPHYWHALFIIFRLFKDIYRLPWCFAPC